jgi:opacity protein-like surface antigen
MSIDNTLSFSGGLLLPRSSSGGDTWVDPLVGVRVILPIGSGFFANAYGDVGGGPNGDLTWQLYGGVGYNFNQSVAACFGYRYLAINHDVNDFGFDIAQEGPLIGLGIRF